MTHFIPVLGSKTALEKSIPPFLKFESNGILKTNINQYLKMEATEKQFLKLCLNLSQTLLTSVE